MKKLVMIALASGFMALILTGCSSNQVASRYVPEPVRADEVVVGQVIYENAWNWGFYPRYADVRTAVLKDTLDKARREFGDDGEIRNVILEDNAKGGIGGAYATSAAAVTSTKYQVKAVAGVMRKK